MTLIESCAHSNYKQSEITQTNSSVIFENNAKSFIKVGDDFFSNLETFMSGDIKTETILIRNHYISDIEMFFRTECFNTETEIKENLLSEVRFKIEKMVKLSMKGHYQQRN